MIKKNKNPPNDEVAHPTRRDLDKLIELYRSEKWDDVETLASSLTRQYPRDHFAWKILGGLYGQSGRYEQALIAFRNSLQVEPQDAETHSNLAVMLQELGRLEQAIDSYEQAIRLKPEFATAHFNLGVTLHELERFREAENSYRRAVTLQPDFAEPYHNLGRVLQQQGRLDDAEVEYRQAITLKPDYVDAYNNYGNTLKTLGRLNEAQASYNQAIALKHDFPEAHFNLGVTLQEQGKLDEALTSYKQAVALQPDYAEVHHNIGIALKALGRTDEAEASYKQVLALKPDYPEAHYNLGVLLQQHERLDEAEVSYRQTIVLRPDHFEAYNNLASTLRALGRLDEARAIYSQVIELKQDYPEAHYNLGLIFEEEGRLDEALSSYSQAVALKPDFLEARMNLNSVAEKAVPPWHISMMNDVSRNNAYSDALKLAVTPGDVVLDIGTGSGLLSLIAAASGAGRVVTCEISKTIAETAKEIIDVNGFKEKISVVNKHSSDLVVGVDLPEKADLIVSEVFSSELVGEGVRATTVDANKRLLKKGGRMIPQSGKVRIALISESNDISVNASVTNVHGFDLSKFNSITQNKFNLRFKGTTRLLSNPEDAFSINLNDDSELGRTEKIIQLQATQEGICLGLVQWIWIQLYEEIQYENKPDENDSHWITPVYLFDEPFAAKIGDIVEIKAVLGDDYVWFCRLK